MLAPAVILALVLNHEFSVMEVLWTFSIYLESVAILPQLFMVSKTGEAESITSHYLFALGMYRALYILNWVYRYYFEGEQTFQGGPEGLVLLLPTSSFQDSTTSSPSWPGASRPSSTATSSICTSPRCSRGRSSSCRPRKEESKAREILRRRTREGGIKKKTAVLAVEQ